MNSEFISIENAEKIVNYDKLLLEKNNLIQYLKNQITINKKNYELYRLKNNKERMLIARTKLAFAQDILIIINKKR